MRFINQRLGRIAAKGEPENWCGRAIAVSLLGNQPEWVLS
jgi:hypothetical protein